MTKSNTQGLTVEDLLETIRSLPPDPLAAFMRERGFDPDKGCIMLLPTWLAYHLGPFIPRYVRTRGDINDVFLLNPQYQSEEEWS